MSDPVHILERLSGHWAGIPGNEAAARDWLAVIAATRDADHVADTLIRGWQRDRNPRIADWHETATQRIERQRLETQTAERLAIEAVPDDDLLGTRARVQALIRETAAKLADSQRKIAREGYDLAPPPPSRRPWVSEDIPGGPPKGNEMTVAQRDAELAMFGERKVREKRP